MIRRFMKYTLMPMLAGALLLASCVDDDLVKVKERYPVVPDIPVIVPLKVQLSGSRAVTRSAQSDEAERTINTIYVIAFKPEKNPDGTENADAPDEEWVVDNAKSFAIGGIIPYNTKTTLEDTGTGDKGFPMTTGYRKIYAIGNPYTAAGSLTADKLAGVKTLADLKNLESLLNDKQSIERMNFKMSGQAIADDDDEVLTVSEANAGSGTGMILGNYSLVLKRVDARITFEITTVDGSVYSDLAFTLDRYYVNRIPGGTYVFPREKKENADENTWDCQSGGYADSYSTNDFTTSEAGNPMFEFYLLENRQIPQKQIGTSDGDDTHTLYSLREKQEKIDLEEKGSNGETVKNGDFIYANSNSTYVILEGTLTGKRMNNGVKEDMYTKVTYTIHLGNTGSETDHNNVTKVNNYDVERNTHYTYHIKIAGVESIIVEVDKDDEQQPGAEGDVILAQGTYVELDSHYSRYMMALKKSEILNGLSWSVSTPFQKGLHVFETDDSKKETHQAYLNVPTDLDYPETTEFGFGLSETTLSLNDYKWVKFAINRECYKVGENTPCESNKVIKFPGEQTYDGGDNETTLSYRIAGGPYKRTTYYDRVRLYDVNQLLNFLYYKAQNGNDSTPSIFEGDDEVVYITVFIDEYYYIYDPTKVLYRKPTGVDPDDTGEDIDLSLWKRVVNSQNRLLNICVEGSKYSADGESSVSQSVYTISQNPIYSFYEANGDDQDFETAWGVEAKVETSILSATANYSNFRTNYTAINSTSNGRRNTLYTFKEKALQWDKVINTDISNIDNILLSPYNNIWYACLMRNRDLNGDDVVDDSEVRWYLASIDQLTSMWIGEAGIPMAKLYQAEVKENWVSDPDFQAGVSRVHVASSSFRDTASPTTGPWIIWSEEGASLGGVSGSSGFVSNFSYRCVRNLGINLENTDDEPDNYIKFDKSSTPTPIPYTTEEGKTYNELHLDVSRMTNACIRGGLSGNGVLPAHTERDANNRPPLQLAVLWTDENNSNILFPNNNTNFPQNTIHWEQVDEDEYSNRICPLGYRMPNQRELMLIKVAYPTLITSNETLICKTTFSYAGSGVGLDGSTIKKYFGYDAGGNFMLSKGYDAEPVYKTGKIRCVRDATSNQGGN